MLRKLGYEPVAVDRGDKALALLTGPDRERYDSVVRSGYAGFDGLASWPSCARPPSRFQIVQTAHGGIDNVFGEVPARSTSW